MYGGFRLINLLYSHLELLSRTGTIVLALAVLPFPSRFPSLQQLLQDRLLALDRCGQAYFCNLCIQYRGHQNTTLSQWV